MAAVEWYLGLDYEALATDYERQVVVVLDALAGAPGVVAERLWPNEAGQPLPRARVRLGEGAKVTRDALNERLQAHTPSIELSTAGPDTIYVNPQTLQPGEVEIIASALRAALR